MSLSIEQLYIQRQKEKENTIKNCKQAKIISLSQKVRKVFSNPTFISDIEAKLIEYGSVTIKRGPCTCESGGCSDTKGFKEHIQYIIQEWEDKGVVIDFGIDQTFYLKSVPHNRAFPKSTINVR